MTTPPLPPPCPKCGAPLPADAPEGLCPRCLASASLMGETVLPGEEAAPHAPVSIEEIAPHFPQLEILECLGRGGMGIVYKARQKTLNRFVALKLLAPERVHDAAFAERFAREAQALAALSHPGIVTVYDFGETGRFFYLLMEFVDGVNLRQAMQAGRFTPEEALAIVPPVCEALQYAHEHGIVHRDIKPENLLLDKEGRVKIADFGIAKMLSTDGSDVGLAETQPAGTPQYMAPEQKGHRRTDHRADIYSLGVVLYELLTGELPADKLQPPSRKVQIDVRLDEIVLRALEKTPELRYQTAGEFRTQVETVAGTPGAIPPPVADTATELVHPSDSRFSRLAVVGACWAPLFFIFVLLYFTSYQGPPGQHYTGPTATQILLRLTVLPLGLLAPFGTTILGWIAVAKIRRSAGKLYGLGLAVFDGLLFPLLVLDAVIGWVWVIVIKMMLSDSALDTGRYLHSWNPDIVAHLIREWATLVTAVTALIVDVLIVRGVWRRVQSPAGARPAGGPPTAGGMSFRDLSGVLGAACVGASGVLAWVWSDLPPSPVLFRLSLAAATLGLLLALPARKIWLGKLVLTSAAAIVLWLGIFSLVKDAGRISSPQVAVQASEARRAVVATPAIPSASERERSQLNARLLHALEAYLARQNTKEQPGEEIEYRGLIVDLAPTLQSAEITIDQPKPRSTSPHRAEWSRVRVARLIASHDGLGEWTITAKSQELGLLQFKLPIPDEALHGETSPPAGSKVVAEAAASAPAGEERKSAPAAPLPPPKITLLDIERHTRGTIEAWDREGKALSNKIRWIVQPDVILNEEGEAREDRDHYLVSLMVENLPPDEITHGSWSTSFGDGIGSVTLASFHPPDGLPGSLYRITAEIPPERKQVGLRFGIPVRNWKPVLVLQGPAWKGEGIGAPFDRAETPADLGARVSLIPGVFPQDARFGPAPGVPMTRLKLKLPAGIHYEWDWHIVLVDAAGKEYEPDLGGRYRGEYTEFPLDEYDPNMLTADYHLPERSSIVKIIVHARSHERDYQWAEFKDLPLAGAEGEKKSVAAAAKAADPAEAVKLEAERKEAEDKGKALPDRTPEK